MNMKLSDRRVWLKGRLRQLRNTSILLVEEYIQEAEHQDGPGYFDQFENADDLLADFDIYALCSQEADNVSE